MGHYGTRYRLTFEDIELEKKFQALRSASTELRWRSIHYVLIWLLLAAYHELPWGLGGIANWIVGLSVALFPVAVALAGTALSFNKKQWHKWGDSSVIGTSFATVAAVLASAIWKSLKDPTNQQCPVLGSNCPSFVINQANVAVFSLIAVWVNIMSNLLFTTRVHVTVANFAAFVFGELVISRTTSSAYYIGIMATVAVSVMRPCATLRALRSALPPARASIPPSRPTAARRWDRCTAAITRSSRCGSTCSSTCAGSEAATPASSSSTT